MMSESHIIFRVDPSLKQLVFRVAKARGEVPSDFVRRVIKTELARLSYLTPEEKKALGFSVLAGRVRPLADNEAITTGAR